MVNSRNENLLEVQPLEFKSNSPEVLDFLREILLTFNFDGTLLSFRSDALSGAVDGNERVNHKLW